MEDERKRRKESVHSEKSVVEIIEPSLVGRKRRRRRCARTVKH